MKKIIKPVVIVVLALVLLLGIGVLVYVFPMLQMTPTASGAVADTGVLAVENGANAVYVPAGGGYIAVDAGTNATRLADGMAAQGLDPLAVHTVLLTHSDSDHVAALGLFANAQVYMAGEEQQMVDGTTKRNPLGGNTLPAEVLENRLTLVGQGEVLAIGERTIGCLLTPGHTPGSVSYLVDDRYLFTGDAVKAGDGGMDIHPYTMDKTRATDSMEYIWNLAGVEYVFTAHYGIYPAGELLGSAA